MTSSSRLQVPLAIAAVVALQGCALTTTSLAQPFDKMEQAPITVFRLQDYEAPAPAVGAPALPFQVPPQLMQWAQQGASMLPPGLLPPGLIPGQAPPAADANVQRFHGFPILGSVALTDPRQRQEVLDILGHGNNFQPVHDNCMYAEFGFSIAQVNAPPADVLVSLPCVQVQAQGFAWPYANTGIPADTARRIAAVVQRAFGGG
jgi:hypothetical protein